MFSYVLLNDDFKVGDTFMDKQGVVRTRVNFQAMVGEQCSSSELDLNETCQLLTFLQNVAQSIDDMFFIEQMRAAKVMRLIAIKTALASFYPQIPVDLESYKSAVLAYIPELRDLNETLTPLDPDTWTVDHFNDIFNAYFLLPTTEN
jgi:hypothetical protein